MKNVNSAINKIAINRIPKAAILTALYIVLLTHSMIGCTNTVINNSNVEPTETVPFRKQPEPQEPLIQGQFSGLTGDELIRFYIKGLGGQRGTWHGNGPWESVISNAREGERYVITAEVPGYQSSPANYTIVISGRKAYMVKDGEVTSEESTKLDFQFTPIITPTGD
jgi:hypothetical protein